MSRPDDTQTHNPVPEVKEVYHATHFAFALRDYELIPQTHVYSPWFCFRGYMWRIKSYPKGNHTHEMDLSVYLQCGGPIHHHHQHYQQEHRSMTSKDVVGSSTIITDGDDESDDDVDGYEENDSAKKDNNWSVHARFSIHIVHPSTELAKAVVSTDGLFHDGSVINERWETKMNPKTEIVKKGSHRFRASVADWGFLEMVPLALLQPFGYADKDMNVVILVGLKVRERVLID